MHGFSCGLGFPHWKPSSLHVPQVRHSITKQTLFLLFLRGEMYRFWQHVSASHCHFYRGQLRKEAIRETVDGDKGRAEEKCWVKRRGEAWVGEGQRAPSHVSLVQTFSFFLARVPE